MPYTSEASVGCIKVSLTEYWGNHNVENGCHVKPLTSNGRIGMVPVMTCQYEGLMTDWKVHCGRCGHDRCGVNR
jgi:hypothetical protein